MFLYYIYGKRVAINIELPLFKKIVDCNNFDLKVKVDYREIAGETIIIKETDKGFTVLLGSLAHYFIDSSKNEIHCLTPNFESFFSTFFNIPFSVYCLCKNEILYHACSLLHKGEVLCLTGNKGVGKSTLTAILNSNENFCVFSDDTIHICEDLVVNRAHNLIKQTTETVNALGIATLNVQNIAGKHYSSFEIIDNIVKIGKIFHIVRSDELEFKIIPITSTIKRNSVFRTNIVGVAHMPYSLISKTLKIKPNAKIQFFELIIPNDLNYLIRNKDNLIEIISSVN